MEKSKIASKFYLDKEKDIVVNLIEEKEDELTYILETPNHNTGNLITNLARICGLKTIKNEKDMKIIKGTIPASINGDNEEVYIFRMGGIKVANIYKDGRVAIKATIPAISKTLMSQTKHYNFTINETLVKSYILKKAKFRTDLHTHMNAMLPSDCLIALGLVHQVRYPLYYIKKLGLTLSKKQEEEIYKQREEVEKLFVDSDLKGKYLTRKIDDNTFINFADFILNNLEDARRNIEKIIVDTLNEHGCIEVLLPTLQPDTIWKNSGRYDQYVNEGTMLITESNKGIFCLAPTGEEAMVEFAKEKLKSYKNLPATYYQIGEKYRNEIRTRGYLLRGKSFPMLDAYSFDLDVQGMQESYENVRKAFLEIFEKIGLKVIPIVADNGAMGGKKSEEFMLISEQGEDKILYDENTHIGLNTEILEKENYQEYLKEEYGIEDISNFKEIRTMELGHIFQLGTRYSEMMDGKYVGKDGKESLYYMGCYGIGVSRTVAALYEHCLINDEKWGPSGFVLPESVAPFKVQIVPKMENPEKLELAIKLYEKLKKNNVGAIIDDRENITIGAKMKDCKVLGTPYLVVIGDKQEGENIELENMKTGEKEVLTIEQLLEKLK